MTRGIAYRMGASGYLWAGLLGLCCAGGALALEGTGFGANEEQARQRAAADLAAAIQVQVRAVVESCTQLKGRKAEDCGSRVVNRTATDLPLLGLSYVKVSGGSEAQGAKALLEPASLPLYEQQLARWKKEYIAQSEVLKGAKDRQQRHAILSRQLQALRAFQDHRLVATALGGKIEDAPGSEATLMAEREKLEDRADAMPFAARLLMKDLAGTITAIEPLRAANSREVTPFGSAMADALRAEMTGRGGPPMRLSGEYRILEGGDLDLVLEVRDGSPGSAGELAGVRSVRLAKAGYEGYRAAPLAPNFEQLLKSGEAVSGQLRAEVVTSAGNSSSALLFKNGESVKLVARVNRAAWFYIVGHVIRPDGQFSYLLPIQDGADGQAKFIRRIPGDLANHFVELGEFTVAPPFGAEHLQIVASTQDLAGRLPQHEYDKESEYFVLKNSQGSAMKGLEGTRALRPKPTTERMIAEDTLTFTTSAK